MTLLRYNVSLGVAGAAATVESPVALAEVAPMLMIVELVKAVSWKRVACVLWIPTAEVVKRAILQRLVANKAIPN